MPTPMPVAARELATPRAYALIATTVCETGPQALGAPDAGVPVLAIAPGGTEPGDFVPGPDTDTGLPPLGPGVPGLVPNPPTGGPGLTQPPGVEPPVIGPPLTEPPIVGPPDEEPPVLPPGEEPPTLPPTGPPLIEPPFEPPFEPPVLQPPVIPVPEPATWAMMILGFGLMGARLRAISSAASGSPGRAGRRG